jgi:cytochrome c biogenesis protein CcmG/thiol:disulfide interchange protein DsbE
MDTNETNAWAEERLASLGPQGDWRPDPSRGLSLLREKRAAHALRAKRRIWVGAAMFSACVGVLAFPVTRAFAQRCVDACVVQTAKVTGLFLPRPPGYELGGARKMAPDFALLDASGKTVKLSDYRGQVVLLNFWATWCAPCKAEIPWFVEFERTYHDSNFTVLGVSFDDDGWKAVRPYLEAKSVNYPVMIGDDSVSSAFGGIASLPTTLLIDKAGRIARTHVGLCGKIDYETEIKDLLDEQVR